MTDEYFCEEKEELHNQCIDINPRYYYQVIKMIHNLKNYNFQEFYPTCIFFRGKRFSDRF